MASVSPSQNIGHKLKNLVYGALRRKNGELFYYNNNGECNFITRKKDIINEYQVNAHIDELNMRREFDGVISALDFFNLSEGIIVILNQTDDFTKNGKKIRLVPAHEFCKD